MERCQWKSSEQSPRCGVTCRSWSTDWTDKGDRGPEAEGTSCEGRKQVDGRPRQAILHHCCKHCRSQEEQTKRSSQAVIAPSSNPLGGSVAPVGEKSTPAPASFTLLTPRIGCVTCVTWKLICMSSRPTFSWTFTVTSQLRSVCNTVLCRSMRFDREVWAVLWSTHRPVCASIDHDVDCRSVGCAICIVAVVWLID